MFKSKKKLIGAIIVIFIIFYSFIYRPSVPTASIHIDQKTYELKAIDYNYSSFGKSNTKILIYKSVNELNKYLQNEPEITIHSNQPFTYKNNASNAYTQVSYYSVDQNEPIPRFETKTVQSIEKPGHYILQYSTEFDIGKIANYFVRVHVVK